MPIKESEGQTRVRETRKKQTEKIQRERENKV